MAETRKAGHKPSSIPECWIGRIVLAEYTTGPEIPVVGFANTRARKAQGTLREVGEHGIALEVRGKSVFLAYANLSSIELIEEGA